MQFRCDVTVTRLGRGAEERGITRRGHQNLGPLVQFDIQRVLRYVEPFECAGIAYNGTRVRPGFDHLSLDTATYRTWEKHDAPRFVRRRDVLDISMPNDPFDAAWLAELPAKDMQRSGKAMLAPQVNQSVYRQPVLRQRVTANKYETRPVCLEGTRRVSRRWWRYRMDFAILDGRPACQCCRVLR